MIDPARLLTQLNNTGLQNKDSQLYQLLKDLINVLVSLNANISSNINSSVASVINNTIQQLGGMLENPITEEIYMMSGTAASSGGTASNAIIKTHVEMRT